METKTPFYYRTAFMVGLYAFILAVCLLLQSVLQLLVKYDIACFGFNLKSILNANFALPIETLSWFWTAICAAYIGVDRAKYAVKSAEMEVGKVDIGEPKKLRKTIVISGLLFLLAVLCNVITDADFDLNGFSSAFASSILLYVAGQKTISMTATLGDKNSNGIPDDQE